MSSHDHELVQTVANRIIEIGPGGMVDSLLTYERSFWSLRRLRLSGRGSMSLSLNFLPRILTD